MEIKYQKMNMRKKKKKKLGIEDIPEVKDLNIKKEKI